MTSRRRTPEQEKTRVALQILTAQPEWTVFIEYFRGRIDKETVDRQSPDAGALFMIEGRRSFLRELMGLHDRVRDDGRSGSSDD